MTAKYLPAGAVADRYGVSDRTIDRWVEASVLPKPVYINGRRYWDADELGQRDEARKAEAAA